MWAYLTDCMTWSLVGLALGYLLGQMHASRKKDIW